MYMYIHIEIIFINSAVQKKIHLNPPPVPLPGASQLGDLQPLHQLRGGGLDLGLAAAGGIGGAEIWRKSSKQVAFHR